MTKLAVALGVLYIGVTYYSVTRSSEPTHPCEEGTRCLKPLVTSNDRLSLELWVLEEIKENGEEQSEGSGKGAQNAQKPRRQRPKHKWTAVETCHSAALTFAMSDSRTVFDATNGNCTLELSDEYRKRDGRTLRAKFVLRKVVQNQEVQQSSIRTMPVAEATFDLTRIVEKKVGGSKSIWGFNSAAEPAEEQNAGQTDSKLELKQPSTPFSFPSPAPEEADKESSSPTIAHVPHFKYVREPIVLRIVNDEQVYGMPPYRGDGRLMQTHPADRSRYRPIAYVDDTALQHSSQIELAESSANRPPLKLRIRVSIISPIRDVVNVQVRTGMEMAEGILHESELDEIRYLISDDHLYRFALTQFISFLHIWLDYLAFKDEVGFYVGRTDMGGLSVSSIISRFACSLIIFLYLLDGGGTSWLVLFSVGSGVAADFFKVWKVLKPSLSSAFPFVTIRANLSTIEKETTGYDRIARTYLGLLLYPLIAGSALYALRFYEYKSWWSFVISNLANAVYTFGFIALCPQLYINYRLKSVAHMPWKVFMYKLFNTFVDDVFAFLIEMPLKHKLMTLRDDVVFIIFLFQAYMYRVDKTRANEFGFAYEQEEKESAAAVSSNDIGGQHSDEGITRTEVGNEEKKQSLIT